MVQREKTIYLPELLEDECREKVASGRNDNEKIHKGVKLQRSMPQVHASRYQGLSLLIGRFFHQLHLVLETVNSHRMKATNHTTANHILWLLSK